MKNSKKMEKKIENKKKNMPRIHNKTQTNKRRLIRI